MSGAVSVATLIRRSLSRSCCTAGVHRRTRQVSAPDTGVGLLNSLRPPPREERSWTLQSIGLDRHAKGVRFPSRDVQLFFNIVERISKFSIHANRRDGVTRVTRGTELSIDSRAALAVP